ncbi:hypothetical protein A0J52_08975 [Clostridium sporogenes]|nr:hypothetical protein A0J52_08975 [Clostridium sporogenes]
MIYRFSFKRKIFVFLFEIIKCPRKDLKCKIKILLKMSSPDIVIYVMRLKMINVLSVPHAFMLVKFISFEEKF